MTFARVKDAEDRADGSAIVVAGRRHVPSLPAPEPTMKLSDTDLAVHEVSILPPPPAAPIRGSVGVRSEAPPAGSAPVSRADEGEDMPTMQATRDPGAQLSGGSLPPPPDDGEATVVDPPGFLEDSITVVRRDVQSHGRDRS
jgi:hypothetical protein